MEHPYFLNLSDIILWEWEFHSASIFYMGNK
jgi:hypothetical protein